MKTILLFSIVLLSNYSFAQTQPDTIKTTELKELSLEYKKPKIIRKADRIEFNVENTILSSNNAWEIVKRSPNVQTSADQLSVRGSQSIIVTINDKKVSLTGDELKSLLQNMNGSDIKSVEVITNPPAKYEASGSAVINIKMKINTAKGYKGSINAGYEQGIYARENIGISQYYKTGKFALSGSYQFGTGIYYNEIREVINYPEQLQQWENILHRKNRRDAEHTYRFNADYAIDSLNTLSFGIDGYIAQKNHALYNVPTYIYTHDKQLESYFVTQNNRLTPNSTVNYNLQYDHQFSSKEKLTTTATYTDYHYETSQDVKTDYFITDPRSQRFLTDNEQHIRIFTVRMDYSNNKQWADFETGFKYSRVKAENNLDFSRDMNGELNNDPLLSNIFRYDEKVFAGYVSAGKDWKSWSIKAGLRAELTSVDGNSVHPEQENNQRYFNFFPTFFIQNKASESHLLSFSYGRRITRPAYNYLNPSKSYFSPNSYLIGDVGLKPAISDQLSMTYSYKNKYAAELYYIHEKNPTSQLTIQDNVNNILIQKITNIPGNDYFGLSLSASFDPAPWWSVNLQGGPALQLNHFIFSDGSSLKKQRWGAYGNADMQLTLSKQSGLTADINFMFNTSRLQGPAVAGSTCNLSLGIKKKLFSDRAEITLSLQDIYRGEKFKVTSFYKDQNNFYTYYGDTQRFRLSFKYNFGKNTLKGKEVKQKTDEQQRL
ncbi:TonB-dependent receptor domain-containing protein [Chryseobacterium tongliaoense]|uniref:TonB-dependent receptor domain-containing protein n=1 Tax=Chryseobacterium tongliaoense TaxID=3240933 RepID=UPI003512DF11